LHRSPRHRSQGEPTHNEIQTPAIAYVSGGTHNNFAVVGLQGIDINGNGVTISSYKPRP
jgi:hypothetical protein